MQVTETFLKIAQSSQWLKAESQLQRFSCRSEKAKGFFELVFYPSQLKQPLYLCSYGGEVVWVEKNVFKNSGLGLSRIQHPIVSYVKAHFINKRVQAVEAGENSLKISFKPDGRSIIIVTKRNKSSWKLEIPQKKAFESDFSLMDFSKTTKKPSKGTAQVKHEKLLKNVLSDKLKAQKTLDQNVELFNYFRTKPQDWGDKDFAKKHPKIFAAIEKLRATKLPAFQISNRKIALDSLFKMEKRQQRKLKLASARYETLKEQEVVEKVLVPRTEKNIKKKKQSAVGRLFIFENPKLKVIVGRNKDENIKLYQLARDNDWWFHARGIASSHVWVDRSQNRALFDSNGQLQIEALRLAAALSIFYSKLKKSGQGEVDYCQRRYLKHLKGHKGKFLVERCQSYSMLIKELELKKITKVMQG